MTEAYPERNAIIRVGIVAADPSQLRHALDSFEQGDFEPFMALLEKGVRWDGWQRGHLWWKRTPT